jgi:hypothetical protein
MNTMRKIAKTMQKAEKTMRTITRCSWLAMVPAFCACSGGVELEDATDEAANIASESSELSAIEAHLWNQRDIPVCFNQSTAFPTEKTWVRETLNGGRSWIHAGNVRFTGFTDCPANLASLPPSIIVWLAPAPTVTYLRGEIDDLHVHVQIDTRPSMLTDYLVCSRNGLPIEQCVRANVLHEFGHALAFGHEHSRSDGKPPGCVDEPAPNEPLPNWDFGPPDANSVMAYCDFRYELSAQDRAGTEFFYGRSRAGDGRLRDYNGDGRSDLLCGKTTGQLSIDLATSSGAFNGADWTSGSVVLGDLLTGYFDQNAQADVVIQPVDSNVQGISFGSSSGALIAGGGISSTFCKGSETMVNYVGDFNGDSREDRVCHDYVTGEFWIDYADTSGRFEAEADYYRNGHWCTWPRQIFVGKFNADDRADVLCHDVYTGQKWIDYADSNGRLGGSDWTRAGSWCGNPHRQIHVGDFDGNFRDDILCHDTSTGQVYLGSLHGHRLVTLPRALS